MKSIYSILLFLFILPFATTGCNENSASTPVADKPAKIEVYYFHYERRCATCIAVEEETQKALNELYSAKLKKGDITFKSVNLEEKQGEALADKLKVAGQSLVIVNNGKVTDITEQGFLYAKSSPEKLKSEIKKNIDPMLK